MSSHAEAIREIFTSALSSMSPTELMGLTMEPFRDFTQTTALAA